MVHINLLVIPVGEYDPNLELFKIPLKIIWVLVIILLYQMFYSRGHPSIIGKGRISRIYGLIFRKFYLQPPIKLKEK